LRYEWDLRKATANRAKHGVDFEDAITAFDDPFALIAIDLLHSTEDEARHWLIGEADTGVLVVVFTVREAGEVFRLISARPASRSERRRYAEAKRVSF
jgi:uncharacterized DUF497 family protein